MAEDNTVYVGKLEFHYGRMLMSHMASPDLKALHEMAAAIGMKREWFQDHKYHPHYDVCKQKKQKAIKLGAVEVSDRQLIDRCYGNLEEKLFKKAI